MIGLLLVEGIVRFFYDPIHLFTDPYNSWLKERYKIGDYTDDVQLGYRPSPRLVAQNAERYKNYFAAPKSKSILLLGDSIADYRYLEKALQEQLSGRNINVWTFSAGGYNTKQEAYYLNHYVEAPANILILEFCLNDFLPSLWVAKNSNDQQVMWDPVGANNTFLFKHWATYRLFKHFELGLKSTQQWSESTPFLNENMVRQGLLDMKSYADKRGIPFFILLYPHFVEYSGANKFLDSAYKVTLKTLTELHIPFIDLHETFKAMDASMVRNSPDDIVHPSLESQKIVAKELLKVIGKDLGLR